MSDEESAEKREKRRQRQRREKEERAKRRANAERSRANNRRFPKPGSRPGHPVQPSSNESGDNLSPPVSEGPPIVQREFPLLRRYLNADPNHPKVRSTCLAFIRYSHLGEEGKRRPCVIVGVTRSSYIVKPLYSEPKRGAGHWRALMLEDWEAAGLNHQSWVGDEVHKVPKDVHFLGTVTLADWNRICLH